VTDLRLVLFQPGYEKLAGVLTTFQLIHRMMKLLAVSSAFAGLRSWWTHLGPLFLPGTAKDQQQNTGTVLWAFPGGCDDNCSQNCKI